MLGKTWKKLLFYYIIIQVYHNMSTNNKDLNKELYNADSIEYYQNLEAVRMRPSMYIGNVETTNGLLNMIMEIIANSVDEHRAGHGNKIEITFFEDYSIQVNDYGRGIPTDVHSSGISALELVVGYLHAGGKFNSKSYNMSGGLHGVGLSVNTALSEDFQITSYRNQKAHSLHYIRGVKQGELQETSDTNRSSGVKIKFLPDNTIFTTIELPMEEFLGKINEIGYLNKKLVFDIKDYCYGTGEQIIHHRGGLVDFLNTIITNPLTKILSVNKENSDGIVNCSFLWQKTDKENIRAFTNNIPQSNGGDHVTGFRHAFTKVIMKYYQEENANNKNATPITGEDIRAGLTAIIAIYIPDPKFTSQTKETLSSSTARKMVDGAISNFLEDWIQRYPNEIKSIIRHIVEKAEMRIMWQKNKTMLDKKKQSLGPITHKFADCQSNDPKIKELYIVEGDSAGGSAKQCRDPKYQAILAVQGKLINVEKVPMWKFLEYKEFKSLVSVLGCGIGDELKIENITFHNIIIMTDADVDGSHIRTLLLTFFFKYMPQVILSGYLYISRPPLFKITQKGHHTYVQDESNMQNFILDHLKTKVNILEPEYSNICDLYVKMVEYKQIIQENFKETNNVFISNFLMFGLLNSKNSGFKIEDVINRFQEKDKIKVNFDFDNNLEEKDFLKFDFAYKSFYVQYKSKITIMKSFVEKINHIVEYLRPIFKNQVKIIYNQKELSFEDPLFFLEYIENHIISQIVIQRYKGLGEMNPDQLWDTVMKPEVRRLDQVLYDEKLLEETEEIFKILLGKDVKERRKFITKHCKFAINSIDV